MTDVQTVEYREIPGETRTQQRSQGFPVYRILFGIQAVALFVVFAAAKGWI